MVLGYFIATGIETVIELGFWSLRKTSSALYNAIYGGNKADDNKNINITKEEFAALHKEISELKQLIKAKN